MGRVEKIDDFYLKNQKIWFFLFKSDFFDLNQIFLIFLNKKKIRWRKRKKVCYFGLGIYFTIVYVPAKANLQHSSACCSLKDHIALPISGLRNLQWQAGRSEFKMIPTLGLCLGCRVDKFDGFYIKNEKIQFFKFK